MSNNNIINAPNYTSYSLISSNNISDVKKDSLEQSNINTNYYDINKDDNNNIQIQT